MRLVPICVVDKGSDEVMRKRLKRLEDQLKTANDSNKVLMAEVKATRKKPAPAHRRADDDDDDDDNDDDSDDNADNNSSCTNGNEGSHTDSCKMDASGTDSDSDIAHKSDDPNLLFSSRKVPTLIPHCTQRAVD